MTAIYIVTYYAPSFLKPGIMASGNAFEVNENWQHMPWAQNLPCNASVMLIFAEDRGC